MLSCNEILEQQCIVFGALLTEYESRLVLTWLEVSWPPHSLLIQATKQKVDKSPV